MIETYLLLAILSFWTGRLYQLHRDIRLLEAKLRNLTEPAAPTPPPSKDGVR